MGTSPLPKYATGGIVSGSWGGVQTAANANHLHYVTPSNLVGKTVSITFNSTNGTMTSPLWQTLTGLSMAPRKKTRGWNGRNQVRCSGCMRWAKRKDALTVTCKHCMGEMPGW